MSSNAKIVTLERLLAIRDAARLQGRTVVHCHGCFDIVHPGHVHHLEFARSLGDLLIVTVSADTHVAKGVNRPLIPDQDRARNLAALEAVDVVHLNHDPTAVELLRQLKPDIYVKGKEYERSIDPRFIAEKQAVLDAGGRVVFSGGEVVYSSTSLIGQSSTLEALQRQKLLRMRQQHGLSDAKLAALIRAMSGLKIVVAGDYILDRYHFCEAVGIASEAPVMSLRSIKTTEYDGGAGVVALHLAALGCEPTLVTTLADDEVAKASPMRMASAGVDVRALKCRRSSVVKERYLVDSAKLFRVEQSSASPLDQAQEQMLADLLIEASRDAAAVIFTDFGYGTLSHGVIAKSLDQIRTRVPVISADISGAHGNLMKFKGVDLICPTEREVRQTVGDFDSGLGNVVATLLLQTNARQAIVTLGQQGLVSFAWPGGDNSRDRLLSDYVPALSETARDPLGAGDALLAAATATLAAGGTLPAASVIGSLAAACEVERVGNHAISADDMIQRLGEDSPGASSFTQPSPGEQRLAV